MRHFFVRCSGWREAHHTALDGCTFKRSRRTLQCVDSHFGTCGGNPIWVINQFIIISCVRKLSWEGNVRLLFAGKLSLKVNVCHPWSISARRFGGREIAATWVSRWYLLAAARRAVRPPISRSRSNTRACAYTKNLSSFAGKKSAKFLNSRAILWWRKTVKVKWVN